jgi:hypothetical protein
MAGEGREFVQGKLNQYQETVRNAANAQEKANYASQAMEILGKTNPTQDDTDALVMLVGRLS